VRLQISDIEPGNLDRLFKYYQRMDKIKNPLDYIKVKDIDCECDHKILYEQIFGEPQDQEQEVMAYKSCKHTLYAAAKRQMKAAPTPDPQVADHFLEYAKKIIDKEVGEELTTFGYSFQDWYCHLDRRKQNDMDLYQQYLIDATALTPAQRRRMAQVNYEGICKVELQGIDGKPRMVCSIPMRTKFVMGPICWHLEEIFQDKFKGYCGGKNLSEMAHMINEYIDQGFTKVVEGDGSAFDNTQDITLKRVDHYIYQRVAHSVYHVDKQLFMDIATQEYKSMDLIYIDSKTKKRRKMFNYKILGSVFSGDADTTLCNTIRMALYNRYVNDQAGLIYGKDYVVFSKGDDFTVMYKDYITDEQIHKLYYRYFLKSAEITDQSTYGLGQVLKMLDIGGPEIIKFCSLRAWVLDNKGHIMLTRDPKKLFNLAKYSRKTKSYNVIQRYTYLIDQAVALKASYEGIDIFDTMAKAYITKAKQLISGLNRYEKQYVLQKVSHALNQSAKDRRKQSCPYIPLETPAYEKFYNIHHRRIKYKIQGDYWETMKRIEKVNTDKYTKTQLQYINSQINEEFSSEELKSVLGIKNFSDE
jgi:hypothetical protein